MPYTIHTFKNAAGDLLGYKVGLPNKAKMSNGRYYLSNKYLTLKQAKRQKLAVSVAEKVVKKIRK